MNVHVPVCAQQILGVGVGGASPSVLSSSLQNVGSKSQGDTIRLPFHTPLGRKQNCRSSPTWSLAGATGIHYLNWSFDGLSSAESRQAEKNMSHIIFNNSSAGFITFLCRALFTVIHFVPLPSSTTGCRFIFCVLALGTSSFWKLTSLSVPRIFFFKFSIPFMQNCLHYRCVLHCELLRAKLWEQSVRGNTYACDPATFQ